MAFNQETIVGEAIQSCFDQTYEPLEIILSDDCSSDRTWDVIQSMAAAYDGPHTVVTNRNQENLGILQHQNRVLELVSGEVIVSCAGDDIALPEKTECLVAAWADDPYNIKAVSSAYIWMSYEGEDLGVFSANSSRSRASEPTALDVIRNKAYCMGAATLWHRDLIDRFGPIPDQAWAEDNPLLLRATLLGRARYIDVPLLRRRIGGVSNPTGKAIVETYFESSARTCERRIGAIEAFLEDLSKVNTSDTRELKAACMHRLGPLHFERRLADLSVSERRKRLPLAIWRTIRTGHPGYLTRALVYAFPDLYIAYRRRRYR